MESLDIAPSDEELTVEVSIERLCEELGEQGILGQDEGSEYFYLASLALECHDRDDYSIEDVLVEFIITERGAELSEEELEEIKEILQ